MHPVETFIQEAHTSYRQDRTRGLRVGRQATRVRR